MPEPIEGKKIGIPIIFKNILIYVQYYTIEL